MTHRDPGDPDDRSSRLDAIVYVESLLPNLLELASHEPLLRYMLQVAHLEAINAVRRLRSHQTFDADPDRADPFPAKPAGVRLAH